MRLDKYLVGNGFSSRTRAARALEKGLVLVNGKPGKASQDVSEQDEIAIRAEEVAFASEGGYKLYKALNEFQESVLGARCIDLGASTGGFTDCLLQAGASTVYAVDVGESQLAPFLAKDARVHCMDRVNARFLKRSDFPFAADVVTADLSFISLTYILPVISELLRDGGRAFVLIKPQFECGGVGQDKHGIVKDRALHEEVIQKIYRAAEEAGFACKKLTNAPLRQGKNVEYVLLAEKGGKSVGLNELIRSVRTLC